MEPKELRRLDEELKELREEDKALAVEITAAEANIKVG